MGGISTEVEMPSTITCVLSLSNASTVRTSTDAKSKSIQMQRMHTHNASPSSELALHALSATTTLRSSRVLTSLVFEMLHELRYSDWRLRDSPPEPE